MTNTNKKTMCFKDLTDKEFQDLSKKAKHELWKLHCRHCHICVMLNGTGGK
jgi:hypothetical protein